MLTMAFPRRKSQTPLSDPTPSRALRGACIAHAVHDGMTDTIYVLLPIWQTQFAISYAMAGLMRGLYSGVMAGLQIKASGLSKRFGRRALLVAGTSLTGIGYLGVRLGVMKTVWLTEAATALLILLILRLGLTPVLALLPLLGLALNGTSSVLYGTVPDFVTGDDRGHAFALFYTGTIGGGALSPIWFGYLSDRLHPVRDAGGRWHAAAGAAAGMSNGRLQRSLA